MHWTGSFDELARLIPELVVADIHLYLGIIDIDYSRADIIEEMAVMRNDYDRSEILAQEIFEPLDGGYIEFIGTNGNGRTKKIMKRSSEL